MKRGKDGIHDPDAVSRAMRATGLSQVGLGRILGVSQASVSSWTRNGKMNEWNHRMLLRLGTVNSDVQGALYFLVHSDRIEDALGVCLGAPPPGMAE